MHNCSYNYSRYVHVIDECQPLEISPNPRFRTYRKTVQLLDHNYDLAKASYDVLGTKRPEEATHAKFCRKLQQVEHGTLIQLCRSGILCQQPRKQHEEGRGQPNVLFSITLQDTCYPSPRHIPSFP